MKKILIAVLAFAIIGVFATGCWHSKETPISDEISTYTVKESGYVGLKRTGAPAGENLTEAIYVQADETINGYILAQCKRDAAWYGSRHCVPGCTWLHCKLLCAAAGICHGIWPAAGIFYSDGQCAESGDCGFKNLYFICGSAV